METKLYIRDGSRFKYVPNMLGMYWNGIILTKEKMQNSIAVVIEQHYDHVVMASLEMSESMMWCKAKEWCENIFYGGRFPSKRELISLSNYFHLISNIWGEENDDIFAYCLDWRNRSICREYKGHSYFSKAIAVKDVSILDLI